MRTFLFIASLLFISNIAEAADCRITNASPSETLHVAALVESAHSAFANGFWIIPPRGSETLPVSEKPTALWLRIVAKKEGKMPFEFPALNRSRMELNPALCEWSEASTGKVFLCNAQSRQSPYRRTLKVSLGNESEANYLRNAITKGKIYSFFRADVNNQSECVYLWK